MPEDIAAEGTDEQVIPQSERRRSTAEDKSIKWAIDMLEQAKHPLILIGAGANRKLTSIGSLGDKLRDGCGICPIRGHAHGDDYRSETD